MSLRVYPDLIVVAAEGLIICEHRRINLLHRLVDGKSSTPPTIDASQALTLTNEPKANVERYDALRKTEVRHHPLHQLSVAINTHDTQR